MTTESKLKAELKGLDISDKVTGFLSWVAPNRGTTSSLTAAVIMQMSVKELIYTSEEGSDIANIQGFVYCNETLSFYEKNKKAILAWLISEAESLSDVCSSAVDMLSQLEPFKNDSVTPDEIAKLMWSTDKQNMKNDQCLYDLYANVVSNLIAVRVINYYADYLDEVKQAA